MSDVVLEVRDLHKRYGKLPALEGVSLTVRGGELFGLLGPNGAGKTTLISILCGLSDANAGEVQLLGKRLTRADRELRRLIGIGTQDVSIYPDLSARENLRFFGKLFRMRGAELEYRIDELLAEVGLTEREHDRVGAFSGGMKRRLNLAAAVVHRPRLLVLDEPTTGVDPQSRNLIFEQVQAMNQAGVTVIYTSHYMEEVEKLCSRIAILDHGKLLACDTLPHLLKMLDTTILFTLTQKPAGFCERLTVLPGVKAASETKTGFTLVVDDIAPTLAKLAMLCRDCGTELATLTTHEPNLERAFLHLTGRALRD